MWFECAVCSYGTNSPRHATAHEKETGHLVIVEMDWTDNEEEVF